MAAKIRKGDTVIVMAGKDKGRQGEVIRVLPEEERVVVRGINLVKKHAKPSMGDPKGGVRQMEAPLHVSNVMMRDPNTGGPTRVGFKTNEKGEKIRIAKKSGAEIADRWSRD